MRDMKSRTKLLKEEELISMALAGASKRFSGDDAVIQFINSVLTTHERNTIGRRLLIARLYLEGYSGAEIREIIQTSPNTLSKVRAWLEAAAVGYATIYDTNKHKVRAERRAPGRAAEPPLSFARLRKSYPAHFLLFNLIAALKK